MVLVDYPRALKIFYDQLHFHDKIKSNALLATISWLNLLALFPRIIKN